MVAPRNSNINSKKRVADHGEVLTGEREVTAMLGLVENETFNIESRFLEPACGNGNFLAEVMSRKLSVVSARYMGSQLEWERYALLATCSLYGIDLLGDNVFACRKRLLELIEENYRSLFKSKVKSEYTSVLRFVLRKNIVWGDALTLKQVKDPELPIVFSEWSPFNGSQVKRKDFSFKELIPEEEGENSLFAADREKYESDTGVPVFFPKPVKEYPPCHYLRLADAE